MMRSIFYLTFLLFCTHGFAQETADEIIIGKKVVLHSDILQEDRTLWIGLPSGYTEDAKYPVFYLLDGDSHFQHTTGSAKFLQNNDKAPGIIIVAILNTDRSRDLTPAPVADNEKDKESIPFDYTTGGGADNFLSFIESELMPFIDSTYATADYQGLIGHSFGGLFAVHTLLQKPDLFEAYISISPSLWYDRQSFLPTAETLLSSTPDLASSFYMTMGNEGGEMLGGGMKFAALMEEHGDKLHWKFVPMPEETHGTVPYRSTYDGMEFIFSDWQPPMPTSFDEFQEAMASGGVETIISKLDTHFASLSKKYGFTVTEESTVNQLGYILMQEKRFDDAIAAMESNTRKFPNSANAFDSLGDAFSANGDSINAKSAYEMAIQLADETNHPIGKYSREKMDKLK